MFYIIIYIVFVYIYTCCIMQLLKHACYISYFFNDFFFFFLAVLGLYCCEQTFCSCGVQASHCGGFSSFRAQALGTWASAVGAPGL